MPVLAVLLVTLLQDACPPPTEHVDWIDVPAFVVQELKVDGGSWKAEEGWKTTGEDLRVEGKIEEGSLEILVTDFNGLHGDSVYLRLSCSPEGHIKAKARSNWHTDVGSQNLGPNTDLHGEVLIESRPTAGREPLRLTFRLHGIQVGFGRAQPMLTEGGVELPLGSMEWSPQISSPVLQEPSGEVPKQELREGSSKWPDGKARSHGWRDATGRRQGIWTTWYSDGTKQSESGFLHGERHGRWVSNREDGRPYEDGHFENGIRDDKWTEYQDQLTTKSGSYVAGKKEGEWIQRWEDGSLWARGAFESGRKSGPWTRWWPNGNKLSEGSYEGGYGVEEWTYWNEDGSVRKVETKRKPPWARK